MSSIWLKIAPMTKNYEQPRDQLERWQRNLLPLMAYMIIGLTLFFFIASCIQLAYLHFSMLNSTNLAPPSVVDVMASKTHTTSAEILAAGKMQTLANLESYALQRRYYQATILLMSRIWIRYLGFVTGMILALVGASFVLGKLQEAGSEATASSSILDFSVKSTSPGIILAVLGTILMLTTIIINHQITVEDAPLYMQIWDKTPSGVKESPELPAVLPTSSNAQAPQLDPLSTPNPQNAKDKAP